MQLDAWAARWRIPQDAITELKRTLGIAHSGTHVKTADYSESAVQNLVRLEASQKGCRLWRNNVGATYTKDGAFLRYGLANESSAVNKLVKSADLIGIRPVIITPAMIGLTLGQFVSREVKTSNWHYTGTEREQAQLRWAEMITSFGGDACFAVGTGTI